MRTHLEGLQARGRAVKELQVTPPLRMRRHWVMFRELASLRQSQVTTVYAGGRVVAVRHPQPMSWSDIHAWATLTKRALSPEDLMVLRALDHTVFANGEEDDDDG